MHVYDLLIIGAGPAGITSAVYAARKKMDFIVLTRDIGGQAAWSSDIENYTGYQFISGPELVMKFEEHMKAYKVPVKFETVTGLYVDGEIISIETDKSSYRSKTTIVASGKRSRELDVEGEREFKNKGLTYCATCDAPLFPEKDVAVVGGGNSALDAALQLVKIARKVYILNLTPQLTGDAVMQEKLMQNDRVEIMNNTKPLAVIGDKMVNGVKAAREGKEFLLDVQGVFVEIGLVPNTDFAGSLEKNELGEIKVDIHNRTNVEGVFAAGDVTNCPEKQIIIAAGEGAKAALSAFKHLSMTL